MEFQGEVSIHNQTELKRRHVRADDRDVMGQDLKKQLPRAMFLEKLAKIDEDIMESGCRDEAPTPQVLKNISWEVQQKSRQHSNEIEVFLHPKGVLLWSQRSIEIFQE